MKKLVISLAVIGACCSIEAATYGTYKTDSKASSYSKTAANVNSLMDELESSYSYKAPIQINNESNESLANVFEEDTPRYINEEGVKENAHEDTYYDEGYLPYEPVDTGEGPETSTIYNGLSGDEPTEHYDEGYLPYEPDTAEPAEPTEERNPISYNGEASTLYGHTDEPEIEPEQPQRSSNLFSLPSNTQQPAGRRGTQPVSEKKQEEVILQNLETTVNKAEKQFTQKVAQVEKNEEAYLESIKKAEKEVVGNARISTQKTEEEGYFSKFKSRIINTAAWGYNKAKNSLLSVVGKATEVASSQASKLSEAGAKLVEKRIDEISNGVSTTINSTLDSAGQRVSNRVDTGINTLKTKIDKVKGTTEE